MCYVRECVVTSTYNSAKPLHACVNHPSSTPSVWPSHANPLWACVGQPLKAGRTIFRSICTSISRPVHIPCLLTHAQVISVALKDTTIGNLYGLVLLSTHFNDNTSKEISFFMLFCVFFSCFIWHIMLPCVLEVKIKKKSNTISMFICSAFCSSICRSWRSLNPFYIQQNWAFLHISIYPGKFTFLRFQNLQLSRLYL